MAGVRDATELNVYKLADAVREHVRGFLRGQEIRRDLTLRDQLSDAAESPCPNIAEGFSRYHPRDNCRFVRTAKSSLSEVIEHLTTAVKKGYLQDSEVAATITLVRRARGAATRYILYLETAEAPHLPRSAPNARKRHRRRSSGSSTGIK